MWKKALHTGAVVAAAGSAHALHQLAVLEGLDEQLAVELAAPVGVENSVLCPGTAAGILQSLNTQLRLAYYHPCESLGCCCQTSRHRCQIELAFGAGDLGDICQELLSGFAAVKFR